MANVVVVGAQWGDEGKGKIVDWLSERADAVVRFQGGHNAGHTLVIDGVTYKLSLLPSGIVRPKKLSFIGNGVVIDPWALISEIETVREQGVEIGPDNLRISESAVLILPLHRNLDLAREKAAGKGKIGTTGRGIGPAYEDKTARRAMRIGDLSEIETLGDKMNRLLFHHDALLKGMDMAPIDRNGLMAELEEIAPKIVPYTRAVWQELDQARRRGDRILYEGAQGAMLDIDHGTYPFVTSSNTVSAQAAVGSPRKPPLDLDRVRAPSTMSSGSAKPIQRAWAKAPSLRSKRTISDVFWENGATSSARSPGAPAGAVGSTRSWSARR